MSILNYNDFLILEKYEDNLRYILSKNNIPEDEIDEYLFAAKDGNLGHYLKMHGKKFTFGILYSIFKDAIEARKKAKLKKGVYKMVHRLAPIILAPFYPIIAITGYILGTTRAFNKLITPLLLEDINDYNFFLKKLINKSMNIAEGEIPVKDRLSRALVVSDNLVSAIRPEILDKFTIFLADKIYNMDLNIEVPDHFVENELKTYINNNFNVDPKIPLKEGYSIDLFK